MSAARFCLFDDLGKFRKDYVREVLGMRLENFPHLITKSSKACDNMRFFRSDIEKQFLTKLTFGERLSDHIASFGGSWKFIISFGVVLVLWIALTRLSWRTALLTRSRLSCLI